MKPQKSGLKNPNVNDYTAFDRINGRHSYQDAVPDGYVEYQVRTRQGGSVFFFNFELAKSMGLIPQDHPHELTPKLKEKILECFALSMSTTSSIKSNLIPKRFVLINTWLLGIYRFSILTNRGKPPGMGGESGMERSDTKGLLGIFLVRVRGRQN